MKNAKRKHAVRKRYYNTLTTHTTEQLTGSIVNTDKIEAKTYYFEAKIDGEFSDRNYPVDGPNQRKAQVMFTRNDSGEKLVSMAK